MEAVKELWKDIEGYEGLYKVSSYGNVLSLKYCGSNRKHLLAPNPDHKGYLMVYLSKRGKTKTFKIHRLVAQEIERLAKERKDQMMDRLKNLSKNTSNEPALLHLIA